MLYCNILVIKVEYSFDLVQLRPTPSAWVIQTSNFTQITRVRNTVQAIAGQKRLRTRGLHGEYYNNVPNDLLATGSRLRIFSEVFWRPVAIQVPDLATVKPRDTQGRRKKRTHDVRFIHRLPHAPICGYATRSRVLDDLHGYLDIPSRMLYPDFDESSQKFKENPKGDELGHAPPLEVKEI